MDSSSPSLPPKPHIVTAADAPTFSFLRHALRSSSIIALDAEWRPVLSAPATPSFPTVALLQIACRFRRPPAAPPAAADDSPIFLLDLFSIPLDSVWELLRDVFVDPNVLKLGFWFKQDLIFLSATFASAACPGFDRVAPFLDITSIYNHLKFQKDNKNCSGNTASLATICKEMLDISLSKELQCSDWSRRPLSEEQILYAAADVYYLLRIFNIFECKFLIEEKRVINSIEPNNSGAVVGGLKEILEESVNCNNIVKVKFCEACDMVKSSAFKVHTAERIVKAPREWTSSKTLLPMDKSILDIVKIYGERILLKDSDKRPRTHRQRERRSMSMNSKRKEKLQYVGDWQELQGLPPWDSSRGGDGSPKFLCEALLKGLATNLRCVGIDAAIPSSRKYEPRELFDQAIKEKRVILTQDAKLLKYQYSGCEVYKLKTLPKNDQLLEVIEAFGLKICEEELMSRCTKCNGNFDPKPLNYDEAVAITKGAQVIYDFLRTENFFQCKSCKQLFWQGLMYKTAMEKFAPLCKLNH